MPWDGGAASKGLLDYATDADGKIQKGKISDYFGVIDGDGTNRTDYHYPIGKMSGGKPAYDPEGLIAGFVAASGSHGAPSKPALQKRFASIMKSEFPDQLTDGMKEVLGIKKSANAAGDLTPEYLRAFYDAVMAHPGIWEQIKSDIHISARSSAGGQLKGKGKGDVTQVDNPDITSNSLEPSGPVMMSAGRLSNAAPMGHIIYPKIPTDIKTGIDALAWLKQHNQEYVEVEAIPMSEGVFTGTDGKPTLKQFNEFAPYAHWFDGTPITNDHLANHGIPEVMPNTPRPGKLINAHARENRRDIQATARYFVSDLTPEKMDRLMNGPPLHGSPEYRAVLKDESGVWTDGQSYQRKELGPYVVYNYAEVTKGACTPPKCGILLNSHGSVPLRAVPSVGEIDNMTPEEKAALETAAKQLNAANELIASQGKTIEDLTKRLDALEPQLKQMNADAKVVETFKTEQEAQKLAAKKETYKKLLNASAIAEFDKLYPEMDKDLAAWQLANPDKLFKGVEETKLGSKILNAGIVSAMEEAHKALSQVGV
jgi:hypothetical protein